MSPSQHAPRCLPCQPAGNTRPERAAHGEKSFLSAQTTGSRREGPCLTSVCCSTWPRGQHVAQGHTGCTLTGQETQGRWVYPNSGRLSASFHGSEREHGGRAGVAWRMHGCRHTCTCPGTLPRLAQAHRVGLDPEAPRGH